MRKYLLWSRFPFMERSSLREILAYDLIQSNAGNLAFHTSIVRMLMLEDTSFKPIFTGDPSRFSEKVVADYNENYSALIIPLANAFRADYLKYLRTLTGLIRKLRIPCVVVSVGIQMMDGEDFSSNDALKEDVIDFLRAVLDHSALVGLRGEITGDYLKHLGFSEGRHYDITGCPSLYYNGYKVPKIKSPVLDNDSRVFVHAKLKADRKIHDFIDRSCKALPNYTYIAQLLSELRYMLYGWQGQDPMDRKKVPDYYPLNKHSPAYGNVKSVAFVGMKKWIEKMQTADACYGMNIHGTVPALLAGTPAVVIEHDYRIAEIARFYGIPSIPPDRVEKMKDIRDAFETADYTRLQDSYLDHFAHYLWFLEQNGIPNAYDAYPDNRELPADRHFEKIRHDWEIEFTGHVSLMDKLSYIPSALMGKLNRT